MFEYMNYPALIFIVVVFVLPVLFFPKTRETFTMVLTILCIIILFYSAYSDYTTAKVNRAFFQEDRSLKCFSGGGLYTSSNSYRVSNSNGWSLEGDYFIKDSLMIRANNCKEL